MSSANLLKLKSKLSKINFQLQDLNGQKEQLDAKIGLKELEQEELVKEITSIVKIQHCNSGDEQ